MRILVFVLACIAAFPVAAQYPAKPIRFIIPFPPGGGTDTNSRALTRQIAKNTGWTFVIDNKPGAGGNLGTELVVRSAPDGYTLTVNSVGPIAVNPTLYPKLAYNPLTELVPIVLIADVPNVLVLHPSVPAKAFDEFLAYAKANPGKLNYASTGIGTSAHLSGFLLGKRAGIEATHVPYKGADALRDLLAGRVQFMFATIPSVMQHIQGGTLKAVAVSSAKRSRSLPDVPTVAESGFPGFEAGSWFGYFAPKGTPPDVIATLNTAVNEIIGVPTMQAQLVKEGADPVGGTPEQFAQFVQREYEKWKLVVRESGATAE
jgi:tripartite-type tricarboxylate transporter receptor subunit TctC